MHKIEKPLCYGPTEKVLKSRNWPRKRPPGNTEQFRFDRFEGVSTPVASKTKKAMTKAPSKRDLPSLGVGNAVGLAKDMDKLNIYEEIEEENGATGIYIFQITPLPLGNVERGKRERNED